MIGDFVKGSNHLDDYPEGIKNGLLLHRKIDQFTDEHAAVHRAKNYFRTDYRLYSGAFVDVLNDFFLANDPRYFANEKDLLQFTQDTYKTVEKYSQHFPADFKRMFVYMRDENWLYQYRNLKGIKQSFEGVRRRAAYIDNTEKAYETFITHYHILNQCYYELIDDLVNFTKKIIEQQ